MTFQLIAGWWDGFRPDLVGGWLDGYRSAAVVVAVPAAVLYRVRKNRK